MSGCDSPQAAAARYVQAVKSGEYPAQEHCFLSPSGAMETLTTRRSRCARACAQWRAEGLRVAFVPTMGNLHAGHMSLLAAARYRGERVMASIFVNPLQFGPSEDYTAYPRTLGEDQQLLHEAHCDLLFAPGVAEQIYPEWRRPAHADAWCAACPRSWTAASGRAISTAWPPWWRSCLASSHPMSQCSARRTTSSCWWCVT